MIVTLDSKNMCSEDGGSLDHLPIRHDSPQKNAKSSPIVSLYLYVMDSRNPTKHSRLFVAGKSILTVGRSVPGMRYHS